MECIQSEVIIISIGTVFMRPSLWILLTFIVTGYFVADYLHFDTALGIVIGLIIGFLITLKIKMV